MSTLAAPVPTPSQRASLIPDAGRCGICDCKSFTSAHFPKTKCDCGHLKKNHEAQVAAQTSTIIPDGPPPPGKRRLVIFSVNDVYTTEHMGKLKAFIAAKTKQLKPTKALTMLPGDFLGPSTLSLFDQGANMVEVMNAVHFDYICYGNHEFDLKLPTFVDRISKLNSTKLNSNVRFLEAVPPDLDIPRAIVDVQGFKVGLTGLLLKETQKMIEIARGKCPFEIVDVEECFQDAIDALYLDEPDLNMVVALTHQLMPGDRLMAQNANGLHLILGGHEHDIYHEEYNGIPIIKVGENATHCAVIVVDINEDNTFRLAREIIEIQKLTEEAPDVKEMIDAGAASLEKYSSFVLYEPKDGEEISSKNVRNQQTTLGGLFCDLVKDYFRTEVAFISSGKLRAQTTYPKGISFLDVKSELPFGDNQTMFVKMTGAELSEAVRYSRTRCKGQGGFLQTDTGIQVNEETQEITHIVGQPIEKNRNYTASVPLSMLKGMDNNPMISQVGQRNFVNKLLIQDLILLQDAVTMALVHRKWGDLKKPSFKEIQKNGEDVVTRHEFKGAMRDVLPDAMLDLFFDSLASDDSDTLTVDDFDQRFEHFRTVKERNEHVKRPVKNTKGGLKMRRDTLSLWKQRGSYVPPPDGGRFSVFMRGPPPPRASINGRPRASVNVVGSSRAFLDIPGSKRK